MTRKRGPRRKDHVPNEARDRIVDHELTVWTDGSIYMRHLVRPGGYGFVVVDRGREVARGSQAELMSTGNRMELMGVIAGLLRAIPHARGGAPVFVFTDSQYVARGATEWVEGWARKGWTTASGAPVKNRDLWERVMELKGRVRISWHWVRGHSGVEWNEVADKLAGEAARDAMARADQHRE